MDLARAAPPFRPIAAASGIFALFLWRGLAVLDLAGSHIDHQLGGLGKVPRAFGVLWGHEAEYALPGQGCKPESGLPYSKEPTTQ